MSNPYVGEIRMFAGNFAPAGWAFCNGQLMAISENETLFNLIGTTYGGDGQTTFALPDLQSRVPVHQGSNLGTQYVIGQAGGVEEVTLVPGHIPAHSHELNAAVGQADARSIRDNVLSVPDATTMYSNAAPDASMSAGTVATAGSPNTQPHENVQPFVCINFIISLFGIYPSQV